MNSGFLKIGTWRNVPLYCHWSVLLWLPLYGARYGSLLWAAVTFAAFAALLLAHEMGHAIAANSRGLRVFAMRFHVLGGECEHVSAHYERDVVFVAWGGVLAQFCILVAALVAQYLAAIFHVHSEVLAGLFFVFINANIVLIAINLIPVRPLDGHKAWRIIPLFWKTLRPKDGQMPGPLGAGLAGRKRKAADDVERLAAGFRDKVRKRE